MTNHLPLITYDNDTTPVPVLVSFFYLQTTNRLFLAPPLPDKELLDTLIFWVAKKPQCLLSHLHRIYYCYQMQLSDQLYAALVDFFIVLNRRGLAISRRMAAGSRSGLSAKQLRILMQYLKDDNIDGQLLPGNRYSIFSKGIIGTPHMVQLIETKQEPDIDPLELARDFIDYSQLAQAQLVLEAAVFKQPDRLELHEELLAIYRSTRDKAGFQEMFSKLTQTDFALPEGWQLLDAYFNELDK
jgi:hypothetical protein